MRNTARTDRDLCVAECYAALAYCPLPQVEVHLSPGYSPLVVEFMSLTVEELLAVREAVLLDTKDVLRELQEKYARTFAILLAGAVAKKNGNFSATTLGFMEQGQLDRFIGAGRRERGYSKP